MKILQLVTKRQYRGAEVFAANLSAELIALGHEIIFVGLYRNEKDILEVPEAINIDLVTSKTSQFSIAVVQRLVKVIKRTKPEVIQCNGSDTLKYMVMASFFVPDIPVVYRNISMISEWISSNSQKRFYKTLYRRISHVNSVGEEAIEDFVRTFDYPVNKTSVIRRGIPIKELDRDFHRRKLRSDLGLKKGDKIAVHVGNFSPEKNHEFLLEIFSEIKISHPDIKLVCVGTGVLFEEVRIKVQKNGLNDTIYFLGFRKDIPEILAGCDCFVLSSRVEGVPGVILEAGSQKVPSVAINVGGVSEVLLDEETGYLINGFDSRKFKEKLLYLLLNDNIKKAMGKKAFELVDKEYNPGKNALRFEKLYRSLTRPGPEGKLRVLQLIQQEQYRGAEVFCSQLSNHLVDRALEVEVLSIFKGEAELPFKGKISSLARPKNHTYLDVKGWRKLAKYIQAYEPDVVQANAADTLKYTVLSKLFYRWKAPVLYRNASTTSFYVNNIVAKGINAFLLRRVDRIVSVSNASKADLNRLFPFTAKKSTVIPVGIEERTAQGDSMLKEKRINIIHIGSFTKEKNHKGLIRIFQKVLQEQPGMVLNLVGEGPLRTEIEKLLTLNHLHKEVKFWNTTSHPYDFIRSADVLVLPSIIEGLPGVLLEAMSQRVPVVAFNVGGVAEIVTAETGWLIPPGDEVGFAKAILQVVNEPDLLQVENAYTMVKKDYQNRILADRFITEYCSLGRKIMAKTEVS